MNIHGWGRFPTVEARVIRPLDSGECAAAVRAAGTILPRGLGRSYGDSSLADRVLETRHLDHFLSFDEERGLLSCAAGVSLAEILRTFVPRGWFLPVTPGTRFVSVGGAIAADVHGKNHHLAGSFSAHLVDIDLLLGNGERVVASPDVHPELFHATCGGMGLTGVILAARLKLKRIRSSAIVETVIKAPDLDAVLAGFSDQAGSTYSVAWIDCLARGRDLGRSLLMLGEHAAEGGLEVPAGRQWPVPCEMPAGLLNPLTVKAFNTLYYGRVRRAKQTRQIPYGPFFYPLDALADWNRLYGRRGFLQYQCVVPTVAGLTRVLERIAASGRASFLAVLKALGPGTGRYLSFPMRGYTLALDFRAEPSLFALLEELDRIVLAHGGRLNLCKDACMSAGVFRAGYPEWQAFEEVRGRYHAIGKFASLQSRRLGLQ